MPSAEVIKEAPWWANRKAPWQTSRDYARSVRDVLVPRRADTGLPPQFVVVDDNSTWARAVIHKVERVVTSHSYANWDAEGASALDESLLPASLSVLSEFMTDEVPLPQVVPTQSGGLAFEWHTNHESLEVEVQPRGQTIVYFRNSLTGEEWDDAPWTEVRQRVGNKLLGMVS